MIINACAISDIGNVRENNEDNYLLANEYVDGNSLKKTKLFGAKFLVCSVCDGMGGEYNGKAASKIAVSTIRKNTFLLKLGKFKESAIKKLYFKANRSVFRSNTNTKCTMGTTMALLCINKGEYFASNVGDSRIYRYSQGILTQLSNDHTRAQFLINAGLSVDTNSSHNHVLTQYVGMDDNEMIIEPFITQGPINENDIFVLCSDGLYDYVSNNDIVHVLSSNPKLDDAAQLLVSLAKANGSTDNITVILANVRV